MMDVCRGNVNAGKGGVKVAWHNKDIQHVLAKICLVYPIPFHTELVP